MWCVGCAVKFEELAAMGGSRSLTPVPITVRELEFLDLEGGLVRRGTVFVFAMPERLKRALNLSKPLYFLLTSVKTSSIVPLYRSLVLSALAVESLEGESLEPIVVYSTSRLEGYSATMMYELLLDSFGRGYVVSDYGWSSLASFLGAFVEGSVGGGERVSIACNKDEQDLCRVCGIILSRLGILAGIALGDNVLSGSELELFLATGEIKGGSRTRVGSKAVCRVSEGYLVAEGGCTLLWFYRVLGGKEPMLGSFPRKTGLGVCESLAVVGFKRLADALRVLRVL